MTPYEAARAAAVWFDCSAIGTIELEGKDAPTFLHNLSTNDIRNLTVDHGCEAFLCTATAKVVSHLMVWRTAQSLLLDVPAGQSALVLAHLDRYLISEEVLLTDRSAEFARFHVAGPTAASVLGAMPSAGQMLALSLGGISCSLRGVDRVGLPGCDIVVSLSQSPSIREALSSLGMVELPADVVEILRVEAGIPRFGVDLDETTFAPEVGRTAQAISYNKGCYLGQEPIVMARDRGVVQRTLVGLKLMEIVPSGSSVWNKDKEVGRITSCVMSPRLGATLALAYVRRGSQAAGSALEVEVEGQRHGAEVVKVPV